MLGTEPPGRCPDDALGKVFLRACGRVSRRRKSARSRGSVQALAAAPRALEETGARLARAGAMRTLLEGLLHDHLDARDLDARDRYFGIITASVAGKETGQYQFTSALPVTILKLLAPQINARASRDVLARLAKEPLMEPR